MANMKKMVVAGMGAAILLSGFAGTAQAAPEVTFSAKGDATAHTSKAKAPEIIWSASTATASKAKAPEIVWSSVKKTKEPEILKTKFIASYAQDKLYYADGVYAWEDERALRKKGKLLKGEYQGYYYNKGRLAVGEVDGVFYMDGEKVHNDVFLGDYMVDGKRYTGTVGKYLYINGEPPKGEKLFEGEYYNEGYVNVKKFDEGYTKLDGSGKALTGFAPSGAYYKDGKRFTGDLGGLYYDKGTLANSIILVDGKFMYFQDGKPFTGLSPHKQMFVDGKLLTGFAGQKAANSGKIYDVYYENGEAFTGFAVPKGGTEKVEMLNGVVKDGVYEYNAQKNIVFKEGVFQEFRQK